MRDLKKIFVPLMLIVTLMLAGASLAACSNDPDDGEIPKIDTKYTVTYYDDDRTTLLDTRIFTHGDAITYPEVAREGFYTLWKYYDTNGTELSPVDNVTSDIRLEAYYKSIDCMVTVMDSVTGEKLYEQYHDYGDVYIPKFDTSKPGYEFLGFKLDGESEYKENFPLKGTVTILADYKAYKYTLTFKDDITDATIETQTVTWGELKLPSAPKKDGYEFEGWYMQINAVSTRVGGEGDMLLITDDTVLWASYTKKPEK